MGRYRKIESKLWMDKKFRALSTMKPSGQGLWLFLLTAPQTGPMPGFLHAGRAALAEELGWKQKQFDAAFKELADQGMVKADFTARLIWLPNAVKYNQPESPNVIKNWKNEYEILPECALLEEALESLRVHISTMGAAFQEVFDEVFGTVSTKDTVQHSPEGSREASPEPLPKASNDPSGKASLKAMANQEQEQEQEQEQKRENSFSSGFNPNQPEIAQRLAEIAPLWNNLDLGPPFTVTLANLTTDERTHLLTGFDRYASPAIIKAMRNYKEVLDSPDYDPGGCKGYSFFSFLVKGVDRYRDEAKPFEKFRKRGREPPSSSSRKPPTAAEDDQYDTEIRAMMGG